MQYSCYVFSYIGIIDNYYAVAMATSKV